MKPPVLLDTGPLVALLNSREASHKRCVDVLKALDDPLLTTWPVITEAAWLLRQNQKLVTQLLRSVGNGGFVNVAHIDSDDGQMMTEILEQYSDQGFQLADVSLMHLANKLDADTVFTLDVRDFSVFRKSSGDALKIVPSSDS